MEHKTHNNMNNNTAAPQVDDDEIDLVELATKLGDYKKLIFGLPMAAGLVAIVVSLLLTPMYSAKVSLLPPASGGGGGLGSLLGDASGLATLAGISLGGKGGSSAKTYVTLLESRTAMDMAAKRFKLAERYNVEKYEDVYKEIKEKVEILADKKSDLVTIEVLDKDPKFAADLANGYYQILEELQDKLAVTEAQRKRLFFEKQFEEAKNNLADAEVKLTEVQEKTGVLEIQSQAIATVEAVSALRAQIASREVMLSSYQAFATSSNPEYQRTVAELAGLRAQLRKMEATTDGASEGLGISAGRLPKQGLEYVRAFREVKYGQAIFEIMAKQLELAKLEEAKEGAGAQLLDAATPPERKAKPKRAMIVLGSVLMAGFLGLLIAVVLAAMRSNLPEPERNHKIQALKAAWRFRKH